jgi:glyoxylase-like metal-dependent hydrolase (beta-lactamase superfamily II)
MFLIVEDYLTLVDAGFSGSTPYLLDLVRRLGRKPEEIRLIILTHNHLDHTGGLDELRKLTGAKVAAHRKDVFIEGDVVPYPYGDYLGKILKSPVFTPLRRRLVLNRESVDMVLEGGETLGCLGGLQVVPTPGHTPGSISLYSAEYRLLMVGDALNKRRDVVRMPLRTVSTDLKEAANSIRRMAALDVEILCTGHGHPIMHDAGATLKLAVERLAQKSYLKGQSHI